MYGANSNQHMPPVTAPGATKHGPGFGTCVNSTGREVLDPTAAARAGDREPVAGGHQNAPCVTTGPGPKQSVFRWGTIAAGRRAVRSQMTADAQSHASYQIMWRPVA